MSVDADLGLDAFVPRQIPVTIDAFRGILVTPLTIRTLPEFSRAVQPVLPLLLAGQIVAALTEAPEALLRAISVATGIPEAELPEDPAVFVRLAGAVIEVNMDFFARRLLPADRAAGAAIRQAIQLAAPPGAPSSPGSSSADTASATSSG